MSTKKDFIFLFVSETKKGQRSFIKMNRYCVISLFAIIRVNFLHAFVYNRILLQSLKQNFNFYHHELLFPRGSLTDTFLSATDRTNTDIGYQMEQIDKLEALYRKSRNTFPEYVDFKLLRSVIRDWLQPLPDQYYHRFPSRRIALLMAQLCLFFYFIDHWWSLVQVERAKEG
jgi:hypothetical protein